MFEPSTKADIDYALSMLMHEALRQIADKKDQIKADASMHGAHQGNRTIVIIADAADEIHADCIEQAKSILIDFAKRMGRPVSEVTEWERPHLENLSNVILGEIPEHEFPHDHKRLVAQYQAVFHRRITGIIRELENGYVEETGFAGTTLISNKDGWISANDALASLHMSPSLGAQTIGKRAHAGLIRTRAEKFIHDKLPYYNVDLPCQFWWAEGHAAINQNWKIGDFDTWIDHKTHMQAFGVTFLRTDIEKIVQSSPVKQQSEHVAVMLTALDVETRAVLRHMTNTREQTVRGGTVFHVGSFQEWTVAVAECGQGNVHAATTAERAITNFSPQVALFVGIAGGVKDVTIGDVVVSSKVYGYERGKDTESGFKTRPEANLPAYALEQRARAIKLKQEWKGRLDPELQHAEPKIFIGAIAAGEKVVASTASNIAKFLTEYYGDTLAVEMEGQGFLTGVHINSPVQGCVIRGISDLLDGKADADKAGSQIKAADVAGAIAFEMLATLDFVIKETSGLSELMARRPTLEATRNSTIDATGAKIPGDLPFQFAKADDHSLIAMAGATVTRKDDGTIVVSPGNTPTQFPPPTGELSSLSNEELKCFAKRLCSKLLDLQQRLSSEVNQLRAANGHFDEAEWNAVYLRYRSEYVLTMAVEALSLASESLSRLQSINLTKQSAILGGQMILNKGFYGRTPASDAAEFLDFLVQQIAVTSSS